MPPKAEGPRLSREEHLTQVKQERAGEAQKKAEAKDLKAGQALYEKEWKSAEKRERSKESQEKREKFFSDLKGGVEKTWKGVKSLGPKALDFIKTKAGQGQDMVDSLVAGARYKKQEKVVAKDTRERAMASVRQGEAAMKEHKRGVQAHNQEMRKKEWDQKVTKAKEWGKERVVAVMQLAKETKYSQWDLPVAQFQAKRVDSRVKGMVREIGKEMKVNAAQIADLMKTAHEALDVQGGGKIAQKALSEVKWLQQTQKLLVDQYKHLTGGIGERGQFDKLLQTANIDSLRVSMNHALGDLKFLHDWRKEGRSSDAFQEKYA